MLRTTLIIFTLICSSIFALAQTVENKISKVSTGSGLHTADFDTKLGVLKIYLPSDLTVTETASGTLSFKQKPGSNANIGLSEALSEYSLIVENRPAEVSGNIFLVEVPINLPTGVLSVSLQNSEGKVVNRAFFPVRLTKRGNLPPQVGSTANFKLPVTSKSGQPAVIKGNFDGLLNNSAVSISGTPTRLLAESKKQLVFFTPQTLQGAKVLTLKEGETEVKSPFTVLYVVKVGQPQAETFAAQNPDTGLDNSGEEVLVERDSLTSEIEINDKNEINPADQLPNAAPTPVKPNDEIALGPSTGSLSKPLEIDPDEIKKFSTQRQTSFANEDINELSGLKEQTTSPVVPEKTVKIEPVKPAKPKEETVVSKTPDKDKDLSEIQTTIDEQLTAQFIPLDSKPAKPAATVMKNKDEEPIKPQEITETEPEKPREVKPEKTEPVKTAKAEKNPETKKDPVKETKVKQDDKKPDPGKTEEITETENKEVLEEVVTLEFPEIEGPKLPEFKVAPAEDQKKAAKEEVKPAGDIPKQPEELTVTEKVELTEEIKIEESEFVGPKLPEKNTTTVTNAEKKKTEKEPVESKVADVKPSKEVKQAKQDKKQTASDKKKNDTKDKKKDEKKAQNQYEFVGPVIPEENIKVAKNEDAANKPEKKETSSKTVTEEPDKEKKSPAKKDTEKKNIKDGKQADSKIKAKNEPKKPEKKTDQKKDIKVTEKIKITEQVQTELVGPVLPPGGVKTAKADSKKEAKVNTKKKEKITPVQDKQPKELKKPVKKKDQGKDQRADQNNTAVKPVKKTEVKQNEKKQVAKKKQPANKELKVTKKTGKKKDLVGPQPPKPKEVQTASKGKQEPAPPEINPGSFAVQLGSFKKKSEAADLVARLKSGGYDVYYKRFKVPGKGYWYRVRKGGFANRQAAENYKKTLNLSSYHISSFYVTPEGR